MALRSYAHLLPGAGGMTPHRAAGSPNLSSPDQIQNAQVRLAQHGFESGTRSGLLDRPTRLAVQAFQVSQGLTPTPNGTIDGPTAAALASAPVLTAGNSLNQRRTHAVSHTRPSTSRHVQHPSGGSSSMSTASTKDLRLWAPTGLRVPLILAVAVAANATVLATQNPQMDFRGENFVIDPTIVGPSCTVTVPQVGTTPQVAGGPSGTGVPGTIFSPSQNVPLDFQMMISNQGNAVSTTVVNTNTTVALSFAALLFGQEVEVSQGMQQAAAAGMAPAGAFAGMAPAGAFAGGHYGGRRRG